MSKMSSLVLAASALTAAATVASEIFYGGNAPSFTLVEQPIGGLPMPTPQQLKYGGSISALIHFNMATFFHDGDPGCSRQNWNGCDPEGGCNSSDPNSFAPKNLNVSSWIESMQALGATSSVITAKHGCGFLLWTPEATLPDGSPYTYHAPMPVLDMYVQATQAAGIGHGFYFSLTNNFFLNELGHVVQPPSTLLPGQAQVTQAQYENISLALMTEIWTKFGDLTEVWLDGGCGDMCDRVSALLPSTLAANAVAFNGGGNTSLNPVRWCGTEGGNPSKGPGGSVWSTADCGWCPDGSGSGSPPNATGAAWYPSGVDVTIQQGDHWFYTPGDSLHSLSDLAGFYHNSIGANGHLEIDFAVSRNGDIDPAHAAVYASFGNWIRSCYGAPIAFGTIPAGSTSVVLQLPGGASGVSFDRVSMIEDQTLGQNVITYIVEYMAPGSTQWTTFSSGVTIGSKRIDVGSASTAAAVRLTITSAYSTNVPVTLNVFTGGAACATS